jgi:hypothetical protein
MDRRVWPLSVSLVSAFAATMMPSDARALGPIDVEVAGTIGGGTDPLTNGVRNRYPNPLGLGGGGRAGAAFHGLYGGVAFMYYAGGSESNGFGGSASDHALTYGIEAGYGFELFGLLTIRPQVGLGDYALTYNPGVCKMCNIIQPNRSSTIDNLYLQPGAVALVSLGMLLLGADASVLVVPGIKEPSGGSATTDVAFTAHAQVGLRF